MHKNILRLTSFLIISVISFGACTTTRSASSQKVANQQPSTKAFPPPATLENNDVLNEQEASNDIQELGPVEKAKQAYIKEFGEPTIAFQLGIQGLRVIITTKNLQITSTSNLEINNYHDHLFGNSEAMEKYKTGEVKQKSYTEARVKEWVARWQKRDPFSGLTVWTKPHPFQLQREFLGHVVLGYSTEEANSAELAGLAKPTQWHNDYSYEAAGAVVLFYARKMAQLGYELPGNQSFEHIIATSRPDNMAAVKVLDKLGFSVYKQDERYGSLRCYYKLQVKDLE